MPGAPKATSMVPVTPQLDHPASLALPLASDAPSLRHTKGCGAALGGAPALDTAAAEAT